MSPRFDHEKLNVYHESLRFVACATSLLEQIPKSHSVYNQLYRASTSIPLNIAEGNGKFTVPDRCRFFDIARGSALECAACLDVAVVKGVIPQDNVQQGKESLVKIVSMLIGLIKATSPERMFENAPDYGREPRD